MNRGEHVKIGAITFLFFNYFINQIVNIPNNIEPYALVSAIIGSIMPDILDPPTNWMHRSTNHSKRRLRETKKIFGITAFIGLLSSWFYIFSIFYIISGFFLGYVSHLLADSTTKIGLPG